MKSVLRTLLLLLPVLFLAPVQGIQAVKAFARFPRLILWAWQMPERLEFIDPAQISVAYLDQTIYVQNRVVSEPRFQPMRVAPGTQVIAVVRIEMPEDAGHDSEEIRKQVVDALLRSANRGGIVALQVDFDAVKSQRGFYRDVLLRLRKQMPPNMPLSITALASWCAFDDWIRDLPIDEAVPMMFRMGREGALFHRSGSKATFREPLCRGSMGVSTDEPWPEEITGKRLYVFGVRPWTKDSVEHVVKESAQ
jgi:hypothetical protein